MRVYTNIYIYIYTYVQMYKRVRIPSPPIVLAPPDLGDIT